MTDSEASRSISCPGLVRRSVPLITSPAMIIAWAAERDTASPRSTKIRSRRCLLLPLKVSAISGIDFDNVAFVYKQRHHYLQAGLRRGGLECGIGRIAFNARFGRCNFQHHVISDIDDDRLIAE